MQCPGIVPTHSHALNPRNPRFKVKERARREAATAGGLRNKPIPCPPLTEVHARHIKPIC